MYRYFCIGFIDFMLNGNKITDFTNLFSTNNFKKNDDITLQTLLIFFHQIILKRMMI